jgi:ferredoxin
MQLQVDYTRCTGLGVCESIAPEVFMINEDGSMEVRDPCPSLELRAQIEEAIGSCPTEAISLTD